MLTLPRWTHCAQTRISHPPLCLSSYDLGPCVFLFLLPLRSFLLALLPFDCFLRPHTLSITLCCCFCGVFLSIAFIHRGLMLDIVHVQMYPSHSSPVPSAIVPENTNHWNPLEILRRGPWFWICMCWIVGLLDCWIGICVSLFLSLSFSLSLCARLCFLPFSPFPHLLCGQYWVHTQTKSTTPFDLEQHKKETWKWYRMGAP